METQPLQNFLIQISAIIKQYEKIAELTGENFNVFKILELTTNEVRTHSSFIAELLNPKGSHGKKELFLNLFIQQLQIPDFISEDATVEVEKHTGYISSDFTEGGNIDIIATDKTNRSIIVENKIYAGDQETQLLRYFNYGLKNCKSFVLFYLTLDGKDATEGSKSGLEDDKYKLISYSVEILNWLERCKEKAVDHPILRETINQYIFLIRYLTGQTTNNAMKEEIVAKIIKDKDNLVTLFTILKDDLLNDVKRELLVRLKKQVEEIAEELKLDLPDFDKNLGFNSGETSLITFLLRNSPKKGYFINFTFCAPFTRLIYGIDCEEEYRDEYRIQIAKRLGKGLPWGVWVWVKEFEFPLKDWINAEPWLAIVDGSMKKNIKEKTEYLIKNLEGINL